MKCSLPVLVLLCLLCCDSALADRPGIATKPNRPPINRGQIERPKVTGSLNTQPSVVVVEDAEGRKKILDEEARQKEAARKKAIADHGSPLGGFFPDKNQDPKQMFDH